MKLLVVLAMLATAGILCADITVHNGLISADLNNQPLSQVLNDVRTQTSVNFSLDESVSSMQVSASFHDLTVAQAIKKMLEGTGVNYVVVGGPNGPESIFIGNSERAGQSSKTRPQPYRSVVQPVMPQQPVYVQPDPVYQQQQQINPDERRLPPGKQMKMERERMGLNPLPPTGGGYAPNQQPQPPDKQPVPDPSIDDESDDESEDEDSEE